MKDQQTERFPVILHNVFNIQKMIPLGVALNTGLLRSKGVSVKKHGHFFVVIQEI